MSDSQAVTFKQELVCAVVHGATWGVAMGLAAVVGVIVATALGYNPCP